jgi:cellulose synthase/poly-beta-1,6-N-acetylglucosamine synthase-like glycosyltransferase
MRFGWGEIRYVKSGREYTFFGLIAVLRSSRMRFAMFARSDTSAARIRCLRTALEYFDCATRALATDQAQGAPLDLNDGAPQQRQQRVDAAGSSGDTHQRDTASPARRRTGGKVERRVDAVTKANATPWAKGRVIDFDRLNRQALVWCDQWNRQRDPVTRQSPIERLAAERLPPIPGEWLQAHERNGQFTLWRTSRLEHPDQSEFTGLGRNTVRKAQAIALTAGVLLVLTATPLVIRERRRAIKASRRERSQRSAPRSKRSRVISAAVAKPIADEPFSPVVLKSAINKTDEIVPVSDSPAREEALLATAPPPFGRQRGAFAALGLPSIQEQLRVRSAAEAERWERWGAAQNGARTVVTRPQRYALLLLTATDLILLCLRPQSMLIACIALVTALYFVTGMYKIWLLVRGESANANVAGDVGATEDDLPVYTVLAPLHREGKILPALVERLKSIDYPQDRLQVLLLIEMDDVETQDAVRRCSLPPHISPMIMPPGQPRTKPRALNVGLHEARGDFIVVYDAEDRPERDQLRKAVAAFRSLPENVVCVQGRLNFYNRRQSLLTRLFAVDYAVWYDQFLPGLAHAGHLRAGAFVPLGGTSNHFRVETLRQVGGWDPFNVTEDCDLGARLGRAGLRVAMLDSTTWEEAVPHIRPWIKQRSRWIKGYLQTYLVHMRDPLLLLRQLGLRGFIDFQMLVGASCLVVLINPLMWALMCLYIAGAWTPMDRFIETLFPAPLYYPALLSLVVGNFIFFYCSVYVCVRHDYLDLTRYALLTPAYWVLMSFGAWAGLISLIRNPFYWAKTEHGVSLSHVEGSAPFAERISVN